MVSIILFTPTNKLFFVKKVEEPSFLHDLGHIMVKGEYVSEQMVLRMKTCNGFGESQKKGWLNYLDCHIFVV